MRFYNQINRTMKDRNQRKSKSGSSAYRLVIVIVSDLYCNYIFKL